MFNRRRGCALVITGLSVVLLVALVAWSSSRWSGSGPGAASLAPRGVNGDSKEAGEAKANFREASRQAGLDFRMAFLPNEQGENFKINLYDHGCGVAVADFDGDGWEDIYFVNQLGANALYRNQGDGTFVDVSRAAGVALGDRVCVGAAFADFDNDGHPDLFVTSTRGGNVLFKNMGDGTFKDVTRAAGVDLVAHCQTAVFFDFDNDGYLDLFVTCTGKWTTAGYDRKSRYYPGVADFWDLAHSERELNVLYRNNGNGTFTDVTARAGLKGRGWGGDAAVFDADGDGLLDILVTHMFGRSQLYHNQGDGTFVETTESSLGRTSWGAIGSRAFDYNNDGKLDLLIVDMHSDMWYPTLREKDMSAFIRKNEHMRYPGATGPAVEFKQPWALEMENKYAESFQIQYDKVIFGNTLFKNLGGGRFQEVAQRAGMETFWPWGIATGDFNNDGFEDVFLPSGMGYPYMYWPNRLLMNQGDGTFAERSQQEGIEPPPLGEYLPEPLGGLKAARSSRCAAVADFRHTGRLDIVTNNFNDRPYLFQNHFPGKNYIAFRLQGTKSNRDAVGALVHIYLGSEVMVRQVQAAGGYLSQSSRIAHFGLGDRSHIDRAEIRWPSGTRQRLVNPAVNRVHNIIEPS
jgi:hypothetical protein